MAQWNRFMSGNTKNFAKKSVPLSKVDFFNGDDS